MTIPTVRICVYIILPISFCCPNKTNSCDIREAVWHATHILMCCFVCMKKNVKLMWEKIINTVPISAPFHASLILAQKRTRRKCKQCYKSQFLFVRQRPLLRWAMLLKRLLNPTMIESWSSPPYLYSDTPLISVASCFRYSDINLCVYTCKDS